MDHQSRPGRRPPNNQRDHLIRLAATHPDWAVGCADDVWGRRLARPALPAWACPETTLRLVETARAPHGPAPTALACDGLLVRAHLPLPERLWLWFAVGQPECPHDPISRVVGDHLAARGLRTLLLVGENASWPTSQRVRTWIRDHDRQAHQRGGGVRMLPCRLSSKRPWLNPIEPQ